MQFSYGTIVGALIVIIAIHQDLARNGCSFWFGPQDICFVEEFSHD